MCLGSEGGRQRKTGQEELGVESRQKSHRLNTKWRILVKSVAYGEVEAKYSGEKETCTGDSRKSEWTSSWRKGLTHSLRCILLCCNQTWSTVLVTCLLVAETKYLGKSNLGKGSFIFARFLFLMQSRIPAQGMMPPTVDNLPISLN